MIDRPDKQYFTKQQIWEPEPGVKKLIPTWASEQKALHDICDLQRRCRDEDIIKPEASNIDAKIKKALNQLEKIEKKYAKLEI